MGRERGILEDMKFVDLTVVAIGVGGLKGVLDALQRVVGVAPSSVGRLEAHGETEWAEEGFPLAQERDHAFAKRRSLGGEEDPSAGVDVGVVNARGPWERRGQYAHGEAAFAVVGAGAEAGAGAATGADGLGR